MRNFEFQDQDDSRPRRILDITRQRFRKNFTALRNEVERFEAEYDDFGFDQEEYVISMPSWKIVLDEDGYNLETREDLDYSPGSGALEHMLIQDLDGLYRELE